MTGQNRTRIDKNYIDFSCLKVLFGELTQKILPVATGLNFGPPVSLGGKLADICLIQIITYSG